MQERRKNKRHSLEGKIIIKRLDDANGVREANIDISDVSKTGVGFCCNEILTIGSVYECRLTSGNCSYRKETEYLFLWSYFHWNAGR